MSHLSILPTVLSDAAILERSLISLGHTPGHDDQLRGFAGETVTVLLSLEISDGLRIGWSRQPDGSLALAGDLQRLSRQRALPDLLGRITRTYAALKALDEASKAVPDAVLRISD